MSKTVQTKLSRSGLSSVRRDWSHGSASQPQPIDDKPQKETTEPPMTAAQKRLKLIQEALAELPSASSDHLIPSRMFNKRPSSDLSNSQSLNYEDPPVKKARKLPDSWSQDPHSPSSAISHYSQSTKNTSTAVKAIAAQEAKEVADVFLSAEQTHILKLTEDGNSVFYTGSAGTGKSVLLREIIKRLRKKYKKSSDAVAITASTGIAACNIGGVTIHSFAGIGLGAEKAEDLASKVKRNKKAMTRWLRTKVLIIDEVSMVEGDLFDKLAKVACILLKNTKPFGGIQLIVTGDFFQLPPVTKAGNVKFAFEAEMWGAVVKRTFNLTKVFRQKDQEFVDMLNEMRFGQLSQKSIAKFKSLSRAIIYEDGLNATELFPRREDVERSNDTRLRSISTTSKRYIAIDGGSIIDPNQREKMLSNFMSPKELSLRIDAQVMLIKNTDEHLVNGSMGRVVRFVDPAVYGTESESGQNAGPGGNMKKTSTTAIQEWPVVEFSLANGPKRQMMVMPETWKVELPSGEIQVSRTQLPLILAWAMSIHKSQGQTLERVKVDLGKVFEKGQAYVALSRATSLNGLQVLNFDAGKVQAHHKVVEWSKTLETIQCD